MDLEYHPEPNCTFLFSIFCTILFYTLQGGCARGRLGSYAKLVTARVKRTVPLSPRNNLAQNCRFPAFCAKSEATYEKLLGAKLQISGFLRQVRSNMCGITWRKIADFRLSAPSPKQHMRNYLAQNCRFPAFCAKSDPTCAE